MINLKIALIGEGRSGKTYYLQALNIQQGFPNDQYVENHGLLEFFENHNLFTQQPPVRNHEAVSGTHIYLNQRTGNLSNNQDTVNDVLARARRVYNINIVPLNPFNEDETIECPVCGVSNPAGSTECAICGAELLIEEPNIEPEQIELVTWDLAGSDIEIMINTAYDALRNKDIPEDRKRELKNTDAYRLFERVFLDPDQMGILFMIDPFHCNIPKTPNNEEHIQPCEFITGFESESKKSKRVSLKHKNQYHVRLQNLGNQLHKLVYTIPGDKKVAIVISKIDLVMKKSVKEFIRRTRNNYPSLLRNNGRGNRHDILEYFNEEGIRGEVNYVHVRQMWPFNFIGNMAEVNEATYELFLVSSTGPGINPDAEPQNWVPHAVSEPIAWLLWDG